MGQQQKTIIVNSVINTAVRNMAQHISEQYAGQRLMVVGIMKGAMYFQVDLSRQLTVQHYISYVRASSYHNEMSSGSTVDITGLNEDDIALLPQCHVLLLDELYDTGKTMNDVVQYFKQFNPLSIKTCVAFRKNLGVESEYPLPDYVAIDNLPNVWYVGYGLDNCGLDRHSIDLLAVTKPEGFKVAYDEQLFYSDEVWNELRTKITYFE